MNFLRRYAPMGGFAAAALGAGALLAAAMDTITTPDESDGIQPSFAFHPDIPFQSLKEVPIWNELEQMLDNPYALGSCPAVNGQAIEGNAQGYPARCSTIRRRRSFLPAGCSYDASTGLTPCDDALLPPFVMQPLNYNPFTGEQMRLMRPAFPGVTTFRDPSGVNIGPISAGTTRIHPGDDPALDFNSPLVTDGGDAGEPTGYSAAAVCGNDPISNWVETRSACTNQTGKMLDPTPLPSGSGRGIIRSLRKPTIGQAYTVNSDAALAGRAQDLAPSNPDDYIRDRQMAAVLGKAVFWDMQLGSDGVQACASCHFAAGADTRTRDQLNPDHLGGDTQLELFRNRHLSTSPTAADQNPNQTLLASDFPTHRLRDQSIPGEPLLNPGNVSRDTNDVVSSMGVRLRRFDDIPTPGSSAFGAANNGVRALLPDLGTAITDPIPIFQGLRRVEPRNTPSMINAVFSYDSFWDGRARHDFNGGSVLGATDPQSHVIVDQSGTLVKTRQLIRFASIASQMIGPAISEFEMSFRGRSWPKIAKKLLQGDGSATRPDVTPLALQLVSTSDSVLGPFSNQGGSQCLALGRATASGRPGLCLSYREIIQQAFFPTLWQNTTQHLDGASAVCTNTNVPTDSDGASNGVVSPAGCDPFDGFVLSLATGASSPTNRLQFTQMEANFTLFVGLGLQSWLELLISDDTPFDRFLDRNPDAFRAFAGTTLPLCSQNGNTPPCLTETQGFVRSPSSQQTDRLLGFDLFFGTNLSARNPNFRTARCGGCHAGGTLSDTSIALTTRLTLPDFLPRFSTPGTNLDHRPVGRPRQASGFLLEAAINDNARDGVRRHLIDQQEADANGLSRPEGAAFFDTGMYNIGVRPIDEDVMRGGTDGFGWPLSLATLMLKNLGGVNMIPGTALPTFDPDASSSCAPNCTTGGLFPPTAQDPHINPGFARQPLDPRLPPHLAPWMNPPNLGKTHPTVDEIAGGLNTFTNVPLVDDYLDILGPFNPKAKLNQEKNAAQSFLLGTGPDVNRVGRMGSAKVPALRNVELTGPYFHNGGKLTLRQVVNFYAHGGDFPVTNGPHRDFNIVDLDHDAQSVLGSADRIALTAFLLSLTDERVAHEQGPFDRPEIFLPVDGRAPDNAGSRGTLLTQSSGTSVCGSVVCFRRLTAVGAAGHPDRLPSFLNVVAVPTSGTNNDHFDQ
jgi:cytochrome c peroxidase